MNRSTLAISLGATALALFLIPKKVWCGMMGHNFVTEYEKNRMYLFCPDCKFSTEGWEIGVIPSKTIIKELKNAETNPEPVSSHGSPLNLGL